VAGLKKLVLICQVFLGSGSPAGFQIGIKQDLYLGLASDGFVATIKRKPVIKFIINRHNTIQSHKVLQKLNH
jgi:hypothetical protein